MRRRCPKCNSLTVRKTICLRCKREIDAGLEEARAEQRADQATRMRSTKVDGRISSSSLAMLAAVVAASSYRR